MKKITLLLVLTILRCASALAQTNTSDNETRLLAQQTANLKPAFKQQKCAPPHRPCFVIRPLSELDPNFKPRDKTPQKVRIGEQNFLLPAGFRVRDVGQILNEGGGAPITSARLLGRLIPYTTGFTDFKPNGKPMSWMLDAHMRFQSNFPYSVEILLRKDTVNNYKSVMVQHVTRNPQTWPMNPLPYGLDDYYRPTPQNDANPYIRPETKKRRQFESQEHYLVAAEPVVKTPDGYPLMFSYELSEANMTSKIQTKFELKPIVGVRYEFDHALLEHWYNIHGAVMELIDSLKVKE